MHHTNPFLQKFNFEGFVRFLTTEQVLKAETVANTLAPFDGLDGVIADRSFILAYEALGNVVCRQLGPKGVARFVEKHSAFLSEDEEARFFFTRALLENEAITAKQRAALIDIMPTDYQPSLKRWFHIY